MNIDSNHSVFNNQYTNMAHHLTRQGNKLGINQISNTDTLKDKSIQSSPAQVYGKKSVPKSKVVETIELVPPTESPPDEEES